MTPMETIRLNLDQIKNEAATLVNCAESWVRLEGEFIAKMADEALVALGTEEDDGNE